MFYLTRLTLTGESSIDLYPFRPFTEKIITAVSSIRTDQNMLLLCVVLIQVVNSPTTEKNYHHQRRRRHRRHCHFPHHFRSCKYCPISYCKDEDNWTMYMALLSCSNYNFVWHRYLYIYLPCLHVQHVQYVFSSSDFPVFFDYNYWLSEWGL